MEIQEIVQTQMEIRKLVQSQMTTLSFSRFGRNLEKTSFQTMSKQSSNPPSAKQQHLFTILPQQKLQDFQQKTIKPQTQQTTRINQQDRKNQPKPQSQQSTRSNPNDKKEIQLVNANWLFKRVERSKGIFFKGGPSREKPIEPRYHPRYEMLYPHTPHCYIKDHTLNEVSKLPKENLQERPRSQTVEIRQNHINTPTPLHLQTNRQPIINKTFYMNESFDFFVPKTSQENRSHSFNSYQAHHTINRVGDTIISSKKKAAMPEYEVFKSWNLTQPTRTRGIDFGRPVNKIHPHLRQFKKKPFDLEKIKKEKLNMSELSSY